MTVLSRWERSSADSKSKIRSYIDLNMPQSAEYAMLIIADVAYGRIKKVPLRQIRRDMSNALSRIWKGMHPVDCFGVYGKRDVVLTAFQIYPKLIFWILFIICHEFV